MRGASDEAIWTQRFGPDVFNQSWEASPLCEPSPEREVAGGLTAGNQ
jgi:hypothetical protein